MQTFLPFKDFEKCARVLDSQRLGKQRVEAMQIIRMLSARPYEVLARSPFRQHPAVRMWEGYTDALKLYHNKCLNEWINRGMMNSMEFYVIRGDINPRPSLLDLPAWMGDSRLHYSHQANLYRKDPKYYKMFSIHDKNAPYWWPVTLKDPIKQKAMVEYWARHKPFRTDEYVPPNLDNIPLNVRKIRV